jgi:hypothetical protein
LRESRTVYADREERVELRVGHHREESWVGWAYVGAERWCYLSSWRHDERDPTLSVESIDILHMIRCELDADPIGAVALLTRGELLGHDGHRPL